MPTVSVHSMFHLLLLFWKCNYLRYRGLNGDSLAGEQFHLPNASVDSVPRGVRRSFGLKLFLLFPPVSGGNKQLICCAGAVINYTYESNPQHLFI